MKFHSYKFTVEVTVFPQ